MVKCFTKLILGKRKTDGQGKQKLEKSRTNIVCHVDQELTCSKYLPANNNLPNSDNERTSITRT